MSTVYRIDEQGGFLVADTSKKITAYAVPGSHYAARARQADRAPHIAETMLAMEERWKGSAPQPETVAYKTAIESLKRGISDGSTVAVAKDASHQDVRQDREEIRDLMRRGEFDPATPPHLNYDPLKAGSARLYDSHRESISRQVSEEMGLKHESPRQSR